MPLFILLLSVVFVSFLSAYLSMKDYQELPQRGVLYSLYLIKNTQNFTPEFLNDLYSKTLPHEIIISFEKLLKGSQEALVAYGPKNLLESYQEILGLLELEDYHQKIKEKEVFSWELIPKAQTSFKNKQFESLKLIPLIKRLYLAQNDQVMVQLVLQPLNHKAKKEFQASLRVAVVSEDVSRRSDLARSLDGIFNTQTPLHKKKTNKRTSQIYNFFKKRSLVPKEVSAFRLSGEQILRIVN